jgi:hypothetical protein
LHPQLHLFGCCNHFSPIHWNLQSSMDFINLLFSYLMGFCSQQFIQYVLCRLRHCLCLDCPLLVVNRFSESTSTVRLRSEWLCWLTSRQNSPCARTAPVTIASAVILQQYSRSFAAVKHRCAICYMYSDQALDHFSMRGASNHRIECFGVILEAQISWYQCELIVKVIVDIACFHVFEQPVQSDWN